ncbi:hypothetical protein N836_33840 [Leptolyngbya sp. Heron Island J]|uniref:hypothetical protein n=1 Tax=Leptolyngbya sp. Heron Island J TaxID=1385935 RepID=UPI0003B9F8E8|nr:hypothetical protein [Leptolyngbya sp. Heron Island J]ESA38062.1 hypothetical protein N836_33840 [Leptolyngbya sp. Heron Island J]
MDDAQGNPFIGNPFMQKGKKTPPVEDIPKPQTPTELSLASPEPLNSPTEPSKKSAKPAKSSKSLSKSASKSSTAKSRPSTQRKRTSQPAPLSPTAYSGNGYKVQVLAKIPMPSNPNMPSRDYLWFAVYPIIPRVGDCIFHDGRYFRVDAVFLYENTNESWCADLEVSYYTRRH